MRMICSSRFCLRVSDGCEKGVGFGSHLEAFVLQDPLDGSIFTTGGQLGLEDYTKRAITDNLALGVLDFACLAGESILDLLSNDFCKDFVSVGNQRAAGQNGDVPPMRKPENTPPGLFCDIVLFLRWLRLHFGDWRGTGFLGQLHCTVDV